MRSSTPRRVALREIIRMAGGRWDRSTGLYVDMFSKNLAVYAPRGGEYVWLDGEELLALYHAGDFAAIRKLIADAKRVVSVTAALLQ